MVVMMSITRSDAVIDAFLDDHRQMTQLVQELVQLLEERNIGAARAVADRLDIAAGPHIKFEEEILYPAAAKVAGSKFQQRLVGEHQEVREGIRQLLTARNDKFRDPQFLALITEAIRTGLKHAESCGTLISHLDQFSSHRRQEALDRLLELRRIGQRWTEQQG